MIDILIPNYYRPHRVQFLCENVKLCTRHLYNLLFIQERGDKIGRQEVLKFGASSIIGSFDSYANSINAGYFLTSSPYFFTGSDDIEFTDNWDVPAIKLLETCSSKHVIGHKMLGSGCKPDGTYSTFFTVRRSYIQEHSGVAGMPNLVFYPYYHHEVDREFYWTSINAGVYQACPESVIYHDHREDATNVRTKRMDVTDQRTYWNRRHLFRGA